MTVTQSRGCACFVTNKVSLVSVSLQYVLYLTINDNISKVNYFTKAKYFTLVYAGTLLYFTLLYHSARLLSKVLILI